MGPQGSLFAGSVAWVEGAGMENSNSALPAQKEGAGRQEASCGKTLNEHSDVVSGCLAKLKSVRTGVWISVRVRVR